MHDRVPTIKPTSTATRPSVRPFYIPRSQRADDSLGFFFSTSSDSTYCTFLLKKYSAPAGSEKSGEIKDVCYSTTIRSCSLCCCCCLTGKRITVTACVPLHKSSCFSLAAIALGGNKCRSQPHIILSDSDSFTVRVCRRMSFVH